MPTKYPIVLVHGIVAHDRWKKMKFWGRIPKRIEKSGTKVFFGNTDAWGNYESNAEILRTTIDKILNETQSKKVNIIAHSKGGIDSRYMIWKHDYGDKVASLTTISTPHHGSEIADLIYKQKIIHSRIAKKSLQILGKLYGDISPDIFNVNCLLTTEKMKEFNKVVKPDHQVYYQSIYITMRNSFDDLLFFYSYRYLKNVSGSNDGLISETSAKWGTNVTKIEGGISHVEILDIKRRKISGVNIPNIYSKVVNELEKLGF